jgi:hypothetical protein
VKELIGFAVGAATGAAAALLATAPEGRAFIDKVRQDAEPELAKTAEELEPIARNVVRAARLAMDDLGIATESLRAWIAEAAAGVVPPDGTTTPAEATATPLLEAGDETDEAEAAAGAADEALADTDKAAPALADEPANGDAPAKPE